MQTIALCRCSRPRLTAWLRAAAGALVVSAAPCALAETAANTKVDPVSGSSSGTVQDSEISATDERVEAFSQAIDSFNGSKFDASALAEGNGNLEVGAGKDVESGMRGQAFVSARLVRELDLDVNAVALTMQPGGISFVPTNPFSQAPGRGNRAFLSASLALLVNGQVDRLLFTYLLSLSSTATGFEIDDVTTDNARASIVATDLGDSGVWGVTTGAVTFPLFNLLLTRNPADELALRYDMEAFVEAAIPDLSTVNAAIGDPLDGFGGGRLTLITDVDPPPPPGVPEPGSVALLAAGLFGLASCRVPGSRTRSEMKPHAGTTMKTEMTVVLAIILLALASTARARSSYEVWAIDQSNSPGLTHGGTLYIYDGKELERGRHAADAVPQRIDLGG